MCVYVWVFVCVWGGVYVAFLCAIIHVSCAICLKHGSGQIAGKGRLGARYMFAKIGYQIRYIWQSSVMFYVSSRQNFPEIQLYTINDANGN